MKLLLLVVSAFVVMSCSYPSQSSLDIEESSVGWMHGNCLAIMNTNIVLPHPLMLLRVDHKVVVDKAMIIEKATSGEECYPLMDDREKINTEAGYSFYKVKSKTPVNLALGVLGEGGVVNLKPAYCNTTEGLKFSLYENDSVVWEGYYYLGYESEPTCE